MSFRPGQIVGMREAGLSFRGFGRQIGSDMTLSGKKLFSAMNPDYGCGILTDV